MDVGMCQLQTRFTLLLTLLLTIALLSPDTAHANSQESTTSDNSTVRLLIKFDQTSDDAYGLGTTASIATANASITSFDSSLSTLGWNIIDVPADQAEQIASELQQLPGIVEVTPDYPLELTWEPTDPGYQQGRQWSLETIGTEIAWEFSMGTGVVVAVLDTGIDTNHPDLKNNIVPGYNFVDDNTDVSDQCGHGTHVAGVIAAEANNDNGGIGIAHEAKIMPIKVIGETCRGSHSALMKGIKYAADQGVRILVITSGSTYRHTGVRDAILYAREKGALVVVSAGNTGKEEEFYPGSFEESFTVAGTAPGDTRFEASTFGSQIDISAPATNIYGPFWSKDEGSIYANAQGTSMAAPHVAAVAALVLSLEPELTVEELENRLISTATDLGDEGWDAHYGWGRVSAWGAVAQSERAKQEQSQGTSNVLEGHIRIKNLYESTLSNVAAQSSEQSIIVSWQPPQTETVSRAELAPTEIVIYRSTLPVLESSEAITSIKTAGITSYEDENVVEGQPYYYWIIQAEDNIELTVTASMTATLKPLAQQPLAGALYMPFLNR